MADKKLGDYYKDAQKDWVTVNVTGLTGLGPEGGKKTLKTLKIPKELLKELPEKNAQGWIDEEKNIYEYSMHHKDMKPKVDLETGEIDYYPVIGNYSLKMDMWDQIETDLKDTFMKQALPAYKKGKEDIVKGYGELSKAKGTMEEKYQTALGTLYGQESDIKLGMEKIKTARSDFEADLAERQEKFKKAQGKRRALMRGF